MSWKRNEQAHWINVDDVPSNDHDASTRDYDSVPRTIAYTHDTRPYLQLPHLLSLTWLAYPIISLVFVVFRLQISSDTAKDAAQNVKEDLMASCKAAERAATSAASMPRYLAIATNQQITDAVNGTMNAARATMVLALTIMEAIINFVIDIYRSTFLCFLELVVRGALSILLGAVDAINSGLSTTFNAIRSNIQDDIGGINKLIDTANSVIDKIPFGSVAKIPSISVPNLDGLQNVQLPSDFSTALQNLNNSLPTIADLKNKIEDIVDTPFELVKKDINDTFAGISFDVNTLPLPSQNTVTFCDQMDTSVVDGLSNDLVKIVRIGTAILIVLIVLLIAANCALEWYKWRAMQAHFQRVRQAFVSDPGVTTIAFKGDLYARTTEHDLMSIEGTIGHPWIAKLVLLMQDKLKLRQATKDKLIWFFNYVFFPPALACFLIGVFGLLSVELQLLAIGPIQHHYEQQAASSVTDISNLVATSINASMYNDSATYASQVNARVDAVQSTINDGMFGWVNGTTTTLNDTVNAFYTDVQNLVNTVFGNTILNDPVQEFVRCFIGSKVDAIEAALTFLHDNLHVDIPRVNDTVLVLSPDSVNEAAQPIALAAIGDGNSDDQGIVGRVVAIYVKSLEKERIMFAIFAGLWLLVVLMAFCFLLWESCGPYRRRRSPASVTVFNPFPPPPSNPALGEMYDVPLQDEKPQASAGPFRNLASSTKNFYGSGLRSLMHPKAKGQTSSPGAEVEQYSEKVYAHDQPQQPSPPTMRVGGSSNHWNGLVQSMKNFVPHPSRKQKVEFDAEKFAQRSSDRDEELGLPSPRNDPFSDKHSVEEPHPEAYEPRHPQYEHSTHGYPYYPPPPTLGPMHPPRTPSNNGEVSPGEQRFANEAFDHDHLLPPTLTPGAASDAFIAHPVSPDTYERSIADHANDASLDSVTVHPDLYHSSPSFPEQQSFPQPCTPSDLQHLHHPVAQSLLYTASSFPFPNERYPEHSPDVSQPLSVPIDQDASYEPSVSPYPSLSPSPTDRHSRFFEPDEQRPECTLDPYDVHPRGDNDIDSDVHANVSERSLGFS
ncbi:hypothetical protein C8Q80DRAFT_881646 [Daedaleopsis nitida]|nr:hypothetical protein C8Q80DRAFT_881646 [Daedaleopsis nitida]